MKKSKVIKAGIGYTLGNILLKGLNFLTIPIFTRLLSTSDYGMFNTYAAFESILFIIIGLCLYSSLKNAKFDYKNNYKEYLSSTILLSIFSFIIILAILNLTYPIYVSIFEFDRLILNILIFHSFGTALISFYNQELALKYDYKKFLLISFFNIIINLILSFVLVIYILPNIKWFGRIIGSAIPIIILGVFIIIKYFKSKKPKIDKNIWSYSLKISLPIVPHALSQILLSQFDRIMLKKIISSAAVGIYSFLYNISSILITIGDSLETVWSPWFFEKMKEKNYNIIKTNYRKYLSGISLIFILVILFSNEIIKILGPKEYWKGINTVYPLIIATFFAFLYHFPANIEYYYKKTKYIAIGTTLAATINVILNFIFIPKYTYVAAAYTTMFSYIFYFLFHYSIYKKITKVDLFNIKYFIFHIAEILIVSFISKYFINNLMLRIIILLLSVLFYAYYYKVIKNIKILLINKHTKK